MKTHRYISGLVLLVLGSLYPAGAEDAKAPIECHLSFSVDGGSTFSDTAPNLAAPGEVQVKAEWTVNDPQPIKDNFIFTNLHSAEGDFASANVGHQSWNGAPAWYQRLEKPYFKNPDENTAIYILDLKARPDGVMGNANQWDKDQQKYINAPLVACPALGPGVHHFVFHLNYRLADGSASPMLDVPFAVTIAEAK